MNQTKKNSPTWKVLGILFLLVVAPILWVMLNKTGIHYSKKLPIYFERELSATGDTIYHTIDDFKLVNQNKDTITLANLDDKLLLVSFFFASCETVCPTMNNYLAQHIYTEFEKDDDIRFLSFTVDPYNDTPSVLMAYAKQLNAHLPNWQFLTGSKSVIYDLALTSFKIPGARDEHNGLFHSNKLVLVDKQKRVRGVFETGGQNDKRATIDAVRALKLEYKK
ncbi:MAG: SCO family protein [Bacteroidota bacterium]|nr:SCO family protein [Bacteroidota bacterium]